MYYEKNTFSLDIVYSYKYITQDFKNNKSKILGGIIADFDKPSSCFKNKF